MERRVFRREQHPIYAFFLGDLTSVLEKAGRPEEAARTRDEWFELRLAEKSELAAAHPDSFPLRRDVVMLCLRHASFERARPELDRLLELAPDRAGWWLTAGLLRAYRGDEADYRRLRRELLGRFGETADANDACQIAFASVMAPLEDGQAAAVERLAVRGASVESAKPERQLVLGLALFRAGRFEAALEPLARCVESAPGPALRGAAGYFRSLALRELGRDAEAEAAAAAARVESAKLAPPGAGDIGGETDDWLVCHLAAREAEAARR
jgi:tetratricopeptide (TPR) repeat protein